MASSGITSKRTRFTGAEFIVHFMERQGIQGSPVFLADRFFPCMTP